MIKIEPIVYRPLLENTFIVYDEKSLEAFIVDPGGEAKYVSEIMERFSLKPKFILYTHLHLDHIAGGYELQNLLDLPSYGHEADLYLFKNIDSVAKMLRYPHIAPPELDGYLNDNDEFEIGEEVVKVIHTPGHTPGSTSFLIGENVFSGDTLFKESIGRTDLPGGNHKDIIKSIKEKLYTLPPKTKVAPGHGEYSTIEREKTSNPFVKG